MRRRHASRAGPLALVAALAMALATPAVATHPGKGTPDLGRSCHKANPQGLQSKAHQHCPVDQIIDADGIDTAGDGVPGAIDVTVGTVLETFPDGGTDAGLDMFDRDGDGLWTQGVDDLHVEDPSACATAIRDGTHDLGADCKVLDLNGDLADGDAVQCDISVGFAFVAMVCPPVDVLFHDADGNGAWTPGEDLVQDVNGNGVYD